MSKEWQSIKVLWCRSYLVQLLFGIPSLYKLFDFANIFGDLILLFLGGGGGGEKTMDRCGCTAAACSYI